MSRKVPHAAFVEEYDEETHVSLPETRQVANATAKRSKADIRKPAREPFVEAASDSGYSSRTAATVNSAQSVPPAQKPPVPLKVDTSHKRTELERVRSRTKERPKERPRDRSARPARDDKMHAGPFSAGYPPAHVPRSPSRSQRPEQIYTQQYPRSYWENDRGLYHASTPVEPRQREYRYHSSQGSSYDFPPPSPSPHTSRYPPSAVVQVSQSNRPQGRNARSNSYHANSRPVSFHGMMPPMNGMMYSGSPMDRYGHGPPLSSSAYSNSPVYPPAPLSLYSQQSSYYPFPGAASPPEFHERSLSRPREQQRSRRPSVFEPPPIDYGTSEEDEEDDDEIVEEELPEPTPPPPPPGPPRQARPRLPSHSRSRGEEDYYQYQSMPPPPAPAKSRAPPTIIQKQKRPELPRNPATTASVMSERRPSRSLDMTDLRDVLPEYGYRGPGGRTVIPERNRSLRRPSIAYHDSARSGSPQVAVENSTRRRRPPTVYNYSPSDELEEKQRDVEEYQASQSSKSTAVPMSLSDALLKAKANSQHAGSDSGSQKSRSASSRGSGSDARTRSGGSGVLTTTRSPEDDDNIIMTMNGVTMSFTQESVGGKRINVRTGQTGAVELNIEGKRPKKYLTGGSEYTTTSNNSRKGDRKSDRASRRSSRSTYTGGRY
ncbi:hypothetical protein ASPVEDRAFT_41305 [Aspergillus versicolor CBS 583.65]|uniref:Uncharacterized protein n=1 Tax=Aspergillus versicolor CBS 583.65 TaxID=1036611 RepID=A0A1L9PJL0_ASPVE|nr:uncharacterized protein ASPVEDRAFT_41305 [Aspergillus versicolor CBS 583.65]OJJ01720.1 hypothetical protein ASPVEDRAFT_41305 [Aspergillus versicolor CBS 583.65]